MTRIHRHGHRQTKNLKNTTCETCGSPVPPNRLDRRFCTWKHDPELLTGKECKELRRKSKTKERR